MSSQLGMVMILTDDVPACKAFYTELLGYEVVPQLTSPNGEFIYLHSKSGSADLALQDANKNNYGIPSQHGGIILSFAVDDADATYRDWQAKSVEITSEVVDMGAGRMFSVKDPAGNYLSVYHLYPQVKELQKQIGMA